MAICVQRSDEDRALSNYEKSLEGEKIKGTQGMCDAHSCYSSVQLITGLFLGGGGAYFKGNLI